MGVKSVIVSAILFCLSSCTVLRPGLIDQDSFLNDAIEMKVTGRYGSVNKKTVTFGPFFTSKFNLGSAMTHNDEPNKWHFTIFKESYSNTQQQFAFKQYDSVENCIEVMCTAIQKEKQTQYTTSLTGIETYKDHYTIELFHKGSEEKIIYSMDSLLTIQAGGCSLTLINENKYDKKAGKVFKGILFKQEGETVAAVSLMNEGVVWIKNNSESDCTLLIAAISTALLLKPDFKMNNL